MHIDRIPCTPRKRIDSFQVVCLGSGRLVRGVFLPLLKCAPEEVLVLETPGQRGCPRHGRGSSALEHDRPSASTAPYTGPAYGTLSYVVHTVDSLFAAEADPLNASAGGPGELAGAGNDVHCAEGSAGGFCRSSLVPERFLVDEAYRTEGPQKQPLRVAENGDIILSNTCRMKVDEDRGVKKTMETFKATFLDIAAGVDITYTFFFRRASTSRILFWGGRGVDITLRFVSRHGDTISLFLVRSVSVTGR